MKRILYLFTPWLFLSCSLFENIPPLPPKKPCDPEEMIATYERLPEKLVAYNSDSSLAAFYTQPTTRYQHGILGDRIEAGGLVVIKNCEAYELTLPLEFVFEDLAPRLHDVDQDGNPEFVCLRSKSTGGAGIVIYSLGEEGLRPYASLPEIGRPNRWLNIAAIDDLDEDGSLEIAWVQTPHIGGILKVATLEEGELTVSDTFTGVSNHAIGSRNLDLSLLKVEEGQKILYLPNQARDKVWGFVLEDKKWSKVKEIDLAVDFNKPLAEQLPE